MRLRTTCVAAVLCLGLIFAASAGAAQLFAPVYYPDEISVFNTAPDGTATELPGSPFGIGNYPMGAGVGSVAFAPDGNRAAAAYYFNGGIQGLSVSTTGAVSAAQPIVGSHKGGGLAISPDGRFAYQAVAGSVKGVDAYTIAADGKLTAIAGSPFYPSSNFADVVVAPDGKTLYASDGSAVRPFAINADGSLTAGAAFVAIGASNLLITPDGRHMVILLGSNTLSVRPIAVDGALGSPGTSVTVGSTAVYVMALAPDGSKVFAVDYNGDTLGSSTYSVNAYRIGADSGLTLAGAGSTMPFRGRAIGVAPDGKSIYLGTDSGKLAVASLGPDGVSGPFRETGVWNSGEAIPFIFRPVNAATAAFKVSADSKPLTMRFSGVGSTSPDGSVDGYDWSFGDGANSSGESAVAQHKFAKPGIYRVTLATSNEGCGVATIFTGHTTVCNGSAAAAKTIAVDTPPWITSLKVSPLRVNSRTKIRFKLTEAATLTFTVQRPTSGRSVGGVCKKQTAKNKKSKKCTRWVAVGKRFSARGKPRKINSLKFTGRVKGRKLHKGSYRFSAVAKDKAKGVGPAVTAKFTVAG
ncbi:MAG: PKD domain-containing protein [Solirubrobacterales bacterium]